MLLGSNEGVYSDSKTLMPEEVITKLTQPDWQAVKVYESKAWFAPVMAPGKAFAVPHALTTPLRLMRFTCVPVAVVMPATPAGFVPRVLEMDSAPVGTEKFKARVVPPL